MTMPTRALCLAIVLTLAACSGSEVPSSPATTDCQQGQRVTQEGLLYCVVDTPGFTTAQCAGPQPNGFAQGNVVVCTAETALPDGFEETLAGTGGDDDGLLSNQPGPVTTIVVVNTSDVAIEYPVNLGCDGFAPQFVQTIEVGELSRQNSESGDRPRGCLCPEFCAPEAASEPDPSCEFGSETIPAMGEATATWDGLMWPEQTQGEQVCFTEAYARAESAASVRLIWGTAIVTVGRTSRIDISQCGDGLCPVSVQ